MLKSKKGYLASEILDYQVIDRHSKKIGNITDLLINESTQLVEYIILGSRGLIPVSFIDSDDSIKRVITLSQPKERLNIISSTSKNCCSFGEIKKSIVYDITGSVLGNIEDIAYYPGLKVDFLVRKDGPRFLFPNYFVIPVERMSYFHEKSIVVNVSKDELGLVNFTGFQQLFSKPLQSSEDKRKRYIIVQAPVSTVSFYIKQRDEALKKTTESEYLFIEKLDVLKAVKVSQFVKLFNLILASSPDTFIPISDEDVRKFFGSGTFLACEYYKLIGYCSVTIGAKEEIDQDVGVIAGIGVHPSKRGRNVALALINQSLRYLIDNDVDTIKADIYEINTPSLRLFSSLGFREVGETFLF